MTDQPEKTKARVLSGMRPTGKLHLGNYVGALQNWVKLQDTHTCYFFIADWHALTTDYEDTSRVGDNTVEVLLDWLGAGLDPQKCTMFVQSHIRQHAELHVLFSMVTPLSWLERVPSYKDQQRELANKDLHTYGFLGYPLLQAADILIYQADYVPVGEDQVAHVELTREVARRFNQFYSRGARPLLKEPDVLLTKTPKLLGMDKRKMSKSYGNAILLSEEADELAAKINNSVTDRPKLTDKGSPDRCPVGNLHQIFSPADRLAYITRGCTQAEITCVECKALAIESTEAHLRPIRERRKEFAAKPEQLKKIIQNGDQQALAAAEGTMRAVRDAVGLLSIEGFEQHVAKATTTENVRVPQQAAAAADVNERREIVTAEWVERISKTNPLRRDRPQVFITRKGRKVGVQTAQKRASGLWEFSFPDRPLNVLVLLAEENGFLRDYVLPPRIVQNYWKEFVRDQHAGGTTVRVLLEQTGSGPSLLLSSSNLPIAEFEGNYSELQ